MDLITCQNPECPLNVQFQFSAYFGKKKSGFCPSWVVDLEIFNQGYNANQINLPAF